MSTLASLYRPSLALLTDLYELTMAHGYWRSGMSDREAAFHLFFRENPFGGGFAVAAGLATAIEFLQDLHFAEDDLAFLATLRGNDDRPLLGPDFLAVLGRFRFTCDVEGVPEGTVVFPHEPLLRVSGPLVEAQIVESALLNLVNFQTLVATKAARVAMAARGEPVLEFGLRRAQGIDGALSASRAAHLGGCAATSNVLAGRLWGIPVRGTHAHSWVLSFDDEPEAFGAYARSQPNNGVFLVDTYDTLEGVRHAIAVGKELRRAGHEMVGIRLDSGDLAYLSIQARRMLDEAGFPNAVIVASNDLDERLVAALKDQGARINVWGVGTRLVTAYDQPALGGVYKLSAVREPGGPWLPRVKLSEQAIKTSCPGVLQVRRYLREGLAEADVIYDVASPPGEPCVLVDPADPTRRKRIDPGTPGEDLLVPIFRGGQRVYEVPPLADSRRRASEQLSLFHEGIKRFTHPHEYPVGLEEGLHRHKTDLILRARSLDDRPPEP